MNLEPEKEYELKLPSKLDELDKEFTKELKKLTKSTEKNIEKFRFGQAMNELYHFFWDRFAAVFIEKTKDRLNQDKKEVLLWLLANQLKLLHPFMPFITEEIWSKLPIKNKKMLVVESWPK